MHAPLVLADWLETIDSLNDAISHPDWDATIHNPWFIVGSIIFIAVALLRGWKTMLIVYLGGIVAWYIEANIVNAKGGGGGSVYTFAAAVVVVGGFAIYMLLIRD